MAWPFISDRRLIQYSTTGEGDIGKPSFQDYFSIREAGQKNFHSQRTSPLRPLDPPSPRPLAEMLSKNVSFFGRLPLIVWHIFYVRQPGGNHLKYY